jgi:putative transposase
MARISRGLADGHFYHITNRGNGRQQIFLTDEDYAAFVKLMRDAAAKHEVSLYAYCLMPNHFHLLVAPSEAESLGRWMQWLMTSHVRRHHTHYRSSGHVWQGRYKSFLVQDDVHLITVTRYIEGNPIRCGLATTASGWNWSSHIDRVSGDTRFVKPLPTPLPKDWTKCVDEPMKASELERVRTSVRRQRPLGSPGWQMRICRELGLESTMNPQGRPAKWGQEK